MTELENKNKKGLLLKVECREDAVKLIKECTNLWYVIAAIIFGVNLAFGSSASSFLVLPVLWVLVATGVRFLFSRVAAVILLLFSIHWLYMAIFTLEAAALDIIIAIGQIWAAVRAIEATFLLTGQFAETDQG